MSDKKLSTYPNPTPKPEKRIDFLRLEIRSLRERRQRRLNITRFYTVFGAICLVVSLFIYSRFQHYVALMVATYGFFFLITPLIRSPSEYDTGILTLENELDLLETTQISPEQRAEKLFKHHQYELQKYYDQTLRHSKWIFAIGVVCIFVGFGTISATFYFVISPAAPQKIDDDLPPLAGTI